MTTASLLSGEPPQQDLILVSERGQVDEAVAAGLHDTGFHRRIEHLEGGLQAWMEAGFPLVLTDCKAAGWRAPWSDGSGEPWQLSLLFLAAGMTWLLGGSRLVLSAALLWLLVAILSLMIQRSSKHFLRRCN